ncbi:MAG TPA: aldo/keto reductase [Sedimentisphaerales bacterium]|nr:aldo/keto reductase [Sedimentisphaerales bacterium]
MKEKYKKINRRNFLKTAGAAGLTSAFISVNAKADPNTVSPPRKTQQTELPQVPKRKLGKTGVEVSCLAAGVAFDAVENQIVLTKAVQWGVTCWDTAHRYSGGKSEQGIGKFLARNPHLRSRLFIATKASSATTVDEIEQCLQTSLSRMNTGYIDLFYGIHTLSDPAQLTDELRRWAENAKKRKLIRFFGFSTHSNEVKCLNAAAKLPWIDAVLTRYNFRSGQDPQLQDAVQACYNAGIGLTAMKIQALEVKTQEDKQLTDHFLQRGFTQGQAKIKVVLEDKRFSSACVGMENIAVLTENVAAVLDKTKLSQADKNALDRYARATCSGYCAGCADICDAVLPDMPYISDIMRCLMYYNSYGRPDMAKELFAEIPASAKDRLLGTDYSKAQRLCPQHLPIAQLMAEAVTKLC